MPHQRPEVRTVLLDIFEDWQFLPIMSVLDRAFATELLARHATAPELVSALESAMHPQEGSGDLEHLLAQVDEIAISRGLANIGGRREAFQELIAAINRGISDFAMPRGLHRANGASQWHVTADEERHESASRRRPPPPRRRAGPSWRHHRTRRPTSTT